MSYTSEVFNVMIASPGDVEEERKIIREVIHQWNAAHSQKRNIVLLPVGWESHSSPDMGAAPQAIINEQFLGDCDFLVGVFWTRIGTATDKHPSGTVEEIELFIESEKPAMLYFSSKPVNQDSLDLEQSEALRNFKKSCEKRGLFQEFDSAQDFKQKFLHHLQLKLNQLPMFKGLSPEINEITSKQVELSLEARTLLKEASLDVHGTITNLKTNTTTSVATNGKNLIENNTPREIARWEGALRDLLDRKLIIARGNKGEVFEVTDLGFEMADRV